MKNLAQTFLLLLVLVAATSCSNNEPDGKWDKMKWKAPSGIEQFMEGYYKVPIAGGSFTFTCENYEPWISTLTESGPSYSNKYVHPIPDPHFLSGEWCSVSCVKKKVTFTFSPLDESQARTFEIALTAGDIFYTFLFVQDARMK